MWPFQAMKSGENTYMCIELNFSRQNLEFARACRIFFFIFITTNQKAKKPDITTLCSGKIGFTQEILVAFDTEA